METAFNEFGRLVPGPGAVVYSQVSRHYFKLEQPALDFAAIHQRLKNGFADRGGDLPSPARFEATCRQLRDGGTADPALAALFRGVAVPFLLPVVAAGADYGAVLEQTYLPAVADSFRAGYPKYTFHNHCAGGLAGTISPAPATRHERLLAAAQAGPVAGWYFPCALAEYTVPSQRAMMARLPEAVSLSGGLEVAASLIGTPGLLVKNDGAYPPLLCLSGIRGLEENFFYHFEAYGWNLTFNRRSWLGPVSEYWSGGLTLAASV